MIKESINIIPVVPVEGAAVDDHAADGGAVAADDFGRRMHDDIRAVFDRAKEHRSEEHTSELQSRRNLVCRLLLEKKTNHTRALTHTAPSH